MLEPAGDVLGLPAPALRPAVPLLEARALIPGIGALMLASLLPVIGLVAVAIGGAVPAVLLGGAFVPASPPQPATSSTT